jgi:hypothetical protein
MKRPEVISSHAPTISQEQAEILRDDFIKHAAGEGATVDEQLLLDQIAGEKYDAAMRAAGLEPPDPAEELHPDDVKLMATAGIKLKPRASDYYQQLPQQNTLPADRYDNVLKVTGTWAAELGFSPELGRGLISHIASEGPKLGRLSQADKQAFSEKEATTGEKIFGKAGWAERKAEARDVLKFAPGEITDGLLNSPLMNSVQVVSMLSTHARLVGHIVKRSR